MFSKINIGPSSKNLLFVCIILMAGIIAYSNSFDCSFHFDDDLVFNKVITAHDASLREWINFYPSRPVGILTFAANYNIHRMDVYGYHLVNLIIHLINAFFVWWLVFITFSTPAMKDTPIAEKKHFIAFLTGLLFVTHPLATQSVTYITQRFNSLATLFYLLSLILFIKARLWQDSKNIAAVLFGFSFIFAVCGMLTKEIVFTLPFTVILYDYFFIKTSPWNLGIKNKNLIFSFFILGIFIIFFFKYFSLHIFDTVPPSQGYSYSISMKEYFFTQFSVILTYIRLFFLPINQNLDYDYSISTGFFQIRTFFSFLILLGILSTGVLLFKRYRLVSFGIFWFFLTLSVESSVIPISHDVIYEHRTYLPGFGFFIAFTGAVFDFSRKKYLKTVLLIILLIAVINTVLTYQRNKVWKDDYTLWGDCLKKSPDKARVNFGFGYALYAKGEIKEAIYYYDKAILITPDYAEVYNARGGAYYALGRYQQAFEDFNKVIQIAPDYVKAYNNRGHVYIIFGQYQRAIDDFNEAILLKPYYAETYNNRGDAYAKLGQYQRAIEDFNDAIRLKPDYVKAYNNRGNVYLNHVNKELGCHDAQKVCELGNCVLLEMARNNGYCH